MPREFRKSADFFLEWMARILDSADESPVLPRVDGQKLRDLLTEPLPLESQPLERIDAGLRAISENYRRNEHPRFFGYVCASVDPLGAWADAVCSMLNQPMTAWRSAPAATEIERLVLRWIDELTGFDGPGSGILTSGGSMANFNAAAAALNRCQRQSQAARDHCVLYLTGECHVSVLKAARVLGIAERCVRFVDQDAQRRMVPEALSAAIERDRRQGLAPACVCATAGTANAGAIDPLEAIADICAREKVWMHIDGAYGAPAAMTEDYRWLRKGFRQADSLSIDPHKWLFVPFDAGCLLTRDEQALERTFSLSSEYIAVTEKGPIESFAFFDQGLEMSRRFRGLKIWMLLKLRGVDEIRRTIARNIELRRHLDRLIEREPRLERISSDLSISCFRFLPPGISDDDRLNACNRRILEEINREGEFFMSPTTLDGIYCLRVCIVNFRTRQADIEALVERILRSGGEIVPD